MSSEVPLSELTTEQIQERLEALRARRAQPRGIRSPGTVAAGETLARRGGTRKRATLDEIDFSAIFSSLEGTETTEEAP